MVLTGINSARRSAKSDKSATTRIRLSASGRTMSSNNSKDGRRRNSGGMPIDSRPIGRRRTNSGARPKISAAIAKDRRKTNNKDKPKTSNAATTKGRLRINSGPSSVANGTNSVRIRNNGAGLISSVRTRTSKGDRQKSNDATLTSNDEFKRTRTDAGSIRSARRTNNDATLTSNDEFKRTRTDAGSIRNAKLRTSCDGRTKSSGAERNRNAWHVTIKIEGLVIRTNRDA